VSQTRPARCTQRAYFARVWTVSKAYYSLRAPKGDARGLAEGAAGEASLDGGEGLLEPRRVGGDATCGEIDAWVEITWWRDEWRRRGTVETISEGSSRAWEPEGRAGESETI
jgi:hypothetical protein